MVMEACMTRKAVAGLQTGVRRAGDIANQCDPGMVIFRVFAGENVRGYW